MTSKEFDLLREKAEALDASLMTKLLFLDVIRSMERINGMITEAEIDLTKHDGHGRVELKD